MTSILDELLTAPPPPAPALEPDPLWDTVAGAEIDRSEKWWSQENGVECSSYRERTENKDNEWDDGGGVCSRKAHPPHWKHIAATWGRTCGVWGGEEIPLDPADIDEVDPADVAAPGEFRKLRNRSDLLYVLRVKDDGKVAVLDLSHTSTTTGLDGKIVILPRYRELPSERVVRRKPTAASPTPEQFTQIAAWYSHMRDRERSIAVRELRTDRLTPETLSTMLAELDLAPYRPVWVGLGRLGLRIKVKNRITRPGRAVITDQIGAAFAKWLETNPLRDVEIEYYPGNNSNPSWTNE